MVRLPSTKGDTSCLRNGGTVVADELSRDDVRRIEALIRKVDPLPIIRIGRPEFGGPYQDASDNEFEGMTGEGCGPLSVHGTIYWINRDDGEWRVSGTGQWAS